MTERSRRSLLHPLGVVSAALVLFLVVVVLLGARLRQQVVPWPAGARSAVVAPGAGGALTSGASGSRPAGSAAPGARLSPAGTPSAEPVTRASGSSPASEAGDA